ncbi:hypothetical protein ACWD4K_37605, partial [Streptomyces gelaticus]
SSPVQGWPWQLSYVTRPHASVTASTRGRMPGSIAACHVVDPNDLATVSPLITRTIRRFGDWHLDLTPPKDVIATKLDLAPGALFPTTPVVA